MEEEIRLVPMTREMYHAFFREYENDRDLYLDKAAYADYVYTPEKVDAYIQRQINRERLCFAILLGDEIVGELKLYDIEKKKSATLGIAMKNRTYKDRGVGTRAEQLAIDYVFHQLDIPLLRADAVLTNSRSQHVLEKVGFTLVSSDAQRKYYQILREN